MINVAVMGATGAVGLEIIKILDQRNFPLSSLKLLASRNSAGKTINYKGNAYAVEELTESSFKNIDLVLASAGGDVSAKFAPLAVAAGAVVVDNTSHFRMQADVPLVVPEVNPEDVTWHRGIIANPNCSTIALVVVLKPIYDVAGIKRVVVSTYQAVSGAGLKAIAELKDQVQAVLNQQPVICTIFPNQIAFNCLPRIPQRGGIDKNGYTSEELKMINETKKIFGDPAIQLTATTVRVPVITGHSESVNIETIKKISAAEVREILRKAPGVKVMDDAENNIYPLASECAGMDDTLVGRIREDFSIENGINLWLASDNLRKGAALNAVQIAELLIEKKLLKKNKF
jgi:aspartate-semialdehyde dehydrogenase